MPRSVQSNMSKGEISPRLFGRVDSKMYKQALKTARNAIIHAFGGVSNRPGTLHVGPIKLHSEENTVLHRFQFSNDDQYILEFGDQYFRVIRSDGHVLNTSDGIDGVILGTTTELTVTGHAYSNDDELFITGITDGPTQLNGMRVIVKNQTTNKFDIVRQDDSSNINSVGWTAWVAGGTVADVFEKSTPYVSAHLKDLRFVQSADVITITHPGYDARDLTRSAHTTWTLTAITFAPLQAAPTSPNVTNNAGSQSGTYIYAITAINADSQEESLAVEDATMTTGGNDTPDMTISWTAATGAGRYAIYRKQNGLFGFIGETEAVTFDDVNIIPDLAINPPKSRDPLTGADNRPRATGYYEQRQVFGGSNNKPDTNEFSKTGSRSNFSRSFPLQADDAITATLQSGEVNRIEHYMSGEDLLVFTRDNEWRISAGDDRGFAPATIRQKPQTEFGSDRIPPEQAGRTILFIPRGRARVRSLGFSFQTGQTGGFTSLDLNTLSDHLFAEDGPATYIAEDMAFATFPEPRLHVTRSDGKCCTMTFDEENSVIAWTVWDTFGKFERTEVLKRHINSVEDGVYFIVKRVIGGRTVRHIERTHTRKFVDILDSRFLDDSIILDTPIVVTGVTFDPVVITAASHGLSAGDKVFIRDILWVTDKGANGKETQPDQLNGRTFEVQLVTTNTFRLVCADGAVQ